jgi:hypothetical protein
VAVPADVSRLSVAWWREPTKDQWFAWIAAWLGWMLDAFDFTIFLFIMAPIAKEFGVSVTAVAAVLAVTLWMRLVGAVASGWRCGAAKEPPVPPQTFPVVGVKQLRALSAPDAALLT